MIKTKKIVSSLMAVVVTLSVMFMGVSAANTQNEFHLDDGARVTQFDTDIGVVIPNTIPLVSISDSIFIPFASPTAQGNPTATFKADKSGMFYFSISNFSSKYNLSVIEKTDNGDSKKILLEDLSPNINYAVTNLVEGRSYYLRLSSYYTSGNAYYNRSL